MFFRPSVCSAARLLSRPPVRLLGCRLLTRPLTRPLPRSAVSPSVCPVACRLGHPPVPRPVTPLSGYPSVSLPGCSAAGCPPVPLPGCAPAGCPPVHLSGCLSARHPPVPPLGRSHIRLTARRSEHLSPGRLDRSVTARPREVRVSSSHSLIARPAYAGGEATPPSLSLPVSHSHSLARTHSMSVLAMPAAGCRAARPARRPPRCPPACRRRLFLAQPLHRPGGRWWGGGRCQQ